MPTSSALAGGSPACAGTKLAGYSGIASVAEYPSDLTDGKDRHPLPDSITICSTPPMSKHDTEQLIGDLYHGLRSEAKKAKRKEADGIRRVCRAMYDKKPPTYSEIPPGWDGKEW